MTSQAPHSPTKLKWIHHNLISIIIIYIVIRVSIGSILDMYLPFRSRGPAFKPIGFIIFFFIYLFIYLLHFIFFFFFCSRYFLLYYFLRMYCKTIKRRLGTFHIKCTLYCILTIVNISQFKLFPVNRGNYVLKYH